MTTRTAILTDSILADLESDSMGPAHVAVRNELRTALGILGGLVETGAGGLAHLREGFAPRFAAIGTDGRRPVVWGLGSTEDAAMDDARTELRETGGGDQDLRVVAVSDERAARIERGFVDASDLQVTALADAARGSAAVLAS